LCNFTSYARSALDLHSKAVHLGIKEFKCDICDKAFSQKGSLVLHVNRIHKQLKNYRCELCSYTSDTKNLLKTHSIKKHSQKKDGSDHDLIKPDDQMPETYSKDILKTKEIEIKEEFVADPCAIDIDHKNFDQILLQPTKIEIKEECVADPLAMDIND
jgi:hypothetical protein